MGASRPVASIREKGFSSRSWLAATSGSGQREAYF